MHGDDPLHDAARALSDLADCAPADASATRDVILAAAVRRRRTRAAADTVAGLALVAAIASAGWLQMNASTVGPWLARTMNPAPAPAASTVARAQPSPPASAPVPFAEREKSAVAPLAAVQCAPPAPRVALDASRTVHRASRHAPVLARNETATPSEWGSALDHSYRVNAPAPLAVAPRVIPSPWSSSATLVADDPTWALREQRARNARFIALYPGDRLAVNSPVHALFHEGDPMRPRANPVTLRAWQ